MASDPAYRKERKQYVAKIKAKYHAKHRERLNRTNNHRRMRRQYGMTIEEIEVLFLRQGRACAVCRRPEHEMKQRHVDHDHETGRVRGILCGNCNLAIGHMQDDPDKLRAAASYLESTEPKR